MTIKRLDQFLHHNLYDSLRGYYVKVNPLGRDYTTAPEVSQVFGECIALALVDMWMRCGSPRSFSLVEMGPGQGTLITDIMRTLRKVCPPMAANFQGFLYEYSPILKIKQAQSLEKDGSLQSFQWISCLKLPAQPTFFLANEFFDALPHRQGYYDDHQCYEDYVKITDVGYQRHRCDLKIPPTRARGHWAVSPLGYALWSQILCHVRRHYGGMLWIDYGHESSLKHEEPLKAIFQHRYVNFWDFACQADVSFHSDIQHYYQQACNILGKDNVWKCLQHEALDHYGAKDRFSVLKNGSNLQDKAILEAQYQKLTHPLQMGTFFWIQGVYTGS